MIFSLTDRDLAFLFFLFKAATVCPESLSFSKICIDVTSQLTSNYLQRDFGACMCVSVSPLAAMPVSPNKSVVLAILSGLIIRVNLCGKVNVQQ